MEDKSNVELHIGRVYKNYSTSLLNKVNKYKMYMKQSICKATCKRTEKER